MAAPISVCMIVRNEIQQIESCLKSIRPHVAELCIVDTGSTDGTYEILKKYADRLEKFTDCNDSDGRITSFSMARQKSYELATQPWTLWIDGDDEVVGAENLNNVVALADSNRQGQPMLVMFPYEYAHDSMGKVVCLHYRERLCSPSSSFKWKSPVHEVLTPTGSYIGGIDDSVRIIHHRGTKVTETGRNLRILKAYYEKQGEQDVRALHYLGLEYGNAGDFENSVKFHKRYIQLSDWEDEKFQACIKISEHYHNSGLLEEALSWGYKAVQTRESWAEGYFNLAKTYYFMATRDSKNAHRHWERCAYFARQGLSLPVTKTVLFINPLERAYEIHLFLNWALHQIGDIQGALESTIMGLKYNPGDPGLTKNMKAYQSRIAKSSIDDSLITLLQNQDLTQDEVIHIHETIHGQASNT